MRQRQFERQEDGHRRRTEGKQRHADRETRGEGLAPLHPPQPGEGRRQDAGEECVQPGDSCYNALPAPLREGESLVVYVVQRSKVPVP